MLTARCSRPTAIPECFWEELAAAPDALLLLDYDGTLAPFRVERQKAEPYPGVRRRLREMMRSGATRLVIISGRPAADVGRLLEVTPPPEIWGMHGFERQRPDGGLERRELAPSARRLLRRATRLAEDALPPDGVERKPAAVACTHKRKLHFQDRPLCEGTLMSIRLMAESLRRLAH